MPLAELSDVRCHYELLGSGDPVLMIPGLGATCNVWDCVTPELSKSFSLILPDNRDVGLSLSRRPPLTPLDFCADLIELMDYLQLDRAHVIGMSLGGIVAQRLAMDHPSRIDRLVLISCADRFGPYLREVAKLLGQALRHFPPDLFRRTVELLGSSPQYLDSHIEQVEKQLKLAGTLPIPRAAVARQLRCLDCDDVAMGGRYKIDVPTMVIAGDQDMLIPACYARKMAAKIPSSEFVLVPECGHNPLLERPEIAVPRLIEFLSRPTTDDMLVSRSQEDDLRLKEEALTTR
jgi:pimeloyl-ACP methyl ester carboxylesterase